MRTPTATTSAFLCSGVALAHRLFLSRTYFGQEEGDYGNLGLILGTVQSGFSYVETQHMPLYTWLSAALCIVTNDAHTAALAVSLTMGTIVVFLGTWCTARWLSIEAGLVAGALLAFQPDLALTSATTLRASTYAACAVATMVAIGKARWLIAGLLFGAAFLTRFDAMFTLLPVMGLAATIPSLQGIKSSQTRRAGGLALAGSFVGLWALLYDRIEGTPRFWEAVVARNTENYVDLGFLERLAKGGETLNLVATRVLPDHLGWALLGLFPVGLVLLFRGRARAPAQGRVLGLLALAASSFFTLLILLSAYRWDHNLYWSWLSVAMPFVLPVAAHAATEFVRGLSTRRALAASIAAGLTLATALPMYRQTWQQVIRSDQWIGTQVRLADWADSAAPDDAVLLADLVPATWLGRRPNARPVLRWSQLPEEPLAGDLDLFAAWVLRERVRVIFWFEEDWVGAAKRAPFLALPKQRRARGLTFTPVAHEAGYGVVVYRVDGPGLPALEPPTPK